MRTSFTISFLFAVALLLPLSALAEETPTAGGEPASPAAFEQGAAVEPLPPPKASARKTNIGIDDFVPLTYFEFRTAYFDLAQSYEAALMTVRGDIPYDLGKGWKYSARIDVPFGWSNLVSRTNPAPTRVHFGLSDISLQNLFIAPHRGRWTYGFGIQALFPTATKDELGTGRYQLVPMAGFRYDLGGWMPGAWCDLIVKHYRTVGGDTNRPTINHTAILPRLNIFLPRTWFVLFAPEFRYRWESKKWFVPFDIMVGRKLSDAIVVSVEYKAAIVGVFPLYEQAVEGRIGFLF